MGIIIELCVCKQTNTSSSLWRQIYSVYLFTYRLMPDTGLSARRCGVIFVGNYAFSFRPPFEDRGEQHTNWLVKHDTTTTTTSLWPMGSGQWSPVPHGTRNWRPLWEWGYSGVGFACEIFEQHLEKNRCFKFKVRQSLTHLFQNLCGWSATFSRNDFPKS